MFILQESHLFELLTAKYWNHSNQEECIHLKEDEAISFESLGGVFVIVFVAMALSVFIMIRELCNKKNKIGPIDVVPIVALDRKAVNNKIKHMLAKVN